MTILCQEHFHIRKKKTMEAILIEIPIFDYDGKTIIHHEYYWKIGSFTTEWFSNKELAMDYIKQFM